MKKLLLSLAAICSALTASAKDVWTGDKPVSWDNTLYIESGNFSDANVGDLLTIDFKANAEFGDVIELKSDGKRLAGTRFFNFFTDQTKCEVYITEGMLACLKSTGLEICGNLFNATRVAVDNVGYSMPEGAIWAGWYWCDSWKTLELWKEAFDNYHGERFLVVNISEEPYEFDYDFNIISTWERGAINNGDNTEYSRTQIVLDTQKLEGGLLEAISYNDRVMFQGNCRLEGKGFNITSIVLKGDETGIEGVSGQEDAGRIYSLTGQRLHAPVRGVNIVNGRKFVNVAR
ncbi:MAG: hypothetical protein HUK00_09970 [Bacteroidaceae bacterium]|nr:hypothetical protein [Bacteroidaceae bacterium]